MLQPVLPGLPGQLEHHPETTLVLALAWALKMPLILVTLGPMLVLGCRLESLLVSPPAMLGLTPALAHHLLSLLACSLALVLGTVLRRGTRMVLAGAETGVESAVRAPALRNLSGRYCNLRNCKGSWPPRKHHRCRLRTRRTCTRC